MTFRRILVPVDFSPSSDHALDEAVRLGTGYSSPAGPSGSWGARWRLLSRPPGSLPRGFRTVKLKIGDPDGQDEGTVRAVREAIGRDVELRLDANQAYTADRAIPLLRRLERYEPALIEQPVAAWDLDGLARVSAALDVPVMADEPVSTPTDVLRIVEKRAADLVKIKVMRSGGLHRARKVCAVAEAAGLPVIVGSGHESGIGVAAELHLAAATRAIPYAGGTVESTARKAAMNLEDIRRALGAEPIRYCVNIPGPRAV